MACALLRLSDTALSPEDDWGRNSPPPAMSPDAVLSTLPSALLEHREAAETFCPLLRNGPPRQLLLPMPQITQELLPHPEALTAWYGVCRG